MYQAMRTALSCNAKENSISVGGLLPTDWDTSSEARRLAAE